MGDDPFDDDYVTKFPEGYTYLEEDEVYVPEGNAFERVGNSRLTTYSLKSVKNPYEAFRISMSVIIERTRDILKISDAGIQTLAEICEKDTQIIYKNIPAILLGYVASGYGAELTDDNFRKAVKMCEDLSKRMTDFGNVSEPVILKYATFMLK